MNCATEDSVETVKTVPVFGFGKLVYSSERKKEKSVDVPRMQSNADTAAHTLLPMLLDRLGPSSRIPKVFPSTTYAAVHVTNLDCHSKSCRGPFLQSLYLEV